MKRFFVNMVSRIKYTPLTLVIIGLLIIMVIALIEVGTDNDGIRILTTSLLIVFKEIGLAFIIAGGVTLVIEMNDFVEYFLQRLTDIMVNEKYIDRLTDQQKEKIRKLLDQKLFFKNRSVDPSSFFYTVEGQVIPLLSKCYYEEYRIVIECNIEDNVIKKRIHKTIKIANPMDDIICEEMPISCNMKRINGMDEKELYKVINLTVDSIDKTSEIDLINENLNDDDVYEITFSSKQILNITDSCTIRSQVESIAPLTDIHYHHRISKPCKNYQVTFILPHDEYKVIPHAFGFGVVDQNNLEKQILRNGVSIKFNSWIFPGDGVIFTLVKASGNL